MLYYNLSCMAGNNPDPDGLAGRHHLSYWIWLGRRSSKGRASALRRGERRSNIRQCQNMVPAPEPTMLRFIPEAARAKVPALVVCGIDARARTETIERLLEVGGARWAVISNEIEGPAFAAAATERIAGQMVPHAIGCLCCVTRSGLVSSLRRLFARRAQGEVRIRPGADRNPGRHRSGSGHANPAEQRAGNRVFSPRQRRCSLGQGRQPGRAGAVAPRLQATCHRRQHRARHGVARPLRKSAPARGC